MLIDIKSRKIITFLLVLVFIFKTEILFSKDTFINKQGILCINGRQLEKVFFFNSGKVYRLQVFNDDYKYINDAMSDVIEHTEELGSTILVKDNHIFWDKNKWNNFHTYILNTKSMILRERYILPRKGIKKLFFFYKKDDYYKKTIKLKCHILESWQEIRDYFNSVKD